MYDLVLDDECWQCVKMKFVVHPYSFPLYSSPSLALPPLHLSHQYPHSPPKSPQTILPSPYVGSGTPYPPLLVVLTLVSKLDRLVLVSGSQLHDVASVVVTLGVSDEAAYEGVRGTEEEGSMGQEEAVASVEVARLVVEDLVEMEEGVGVEERRVDVDVRVDVVRRVVVRVEVRRMVVVRRGEEEGEEVWEVLGVAVLV
jgi:hypothetical protein